MQTVMVGYGKFRVPKWLFDLKISCTAKSIYIVLATCSGGLDHTWVSQEYLAKSLNISKRTVQRYLKELDNAGLIAREWKRIKGITRRVYHFLYNKIMGDPPEATQAGKDTPKKAQHTTESISEQPPLAVLPPEESNSVNYLSEDTGDALNIEEDEEDQDEIEDTPEWKEAKKTIALEEPHLSPLFNLLTSRMTDSGLMIEGPNHVVIKTIEQNHRNKIETALRHMGCTLFFFGIQSSEIQEKVEKQYQLQAERATRQIEKARRKQEATRQKEEERLSKLPLKQQFELVANEYPLKKSQWMAWRVFIQMANRRELPTVSVLLKSIRNHKSTDTSWNKDNGRWIPALPKWLRERRWMDKPYG